MPQNIEELELWCPKCNVKFTINDFIENEKSTANFTSFFKKLYSNEIDEIKIKAQKDYEQKIQEQKKSIEDSTKSKYEKEFASKKDELQETINNQKIKISDLNNSIKNYDTQKQLDIQIAIEKQRKELEEKYGEKDIKINDLTDQVNELKVANAQNKAINSAIKGHNSEVTVIEELAETFQQDIIEKINDSGKKADLIHKIKIDSSNEIIGSIIYEIKDTEEWNLNKWEDKFNEDIKRKKGNYGMLVGKKFCDKYGENKLFVVSQKYDNMYFTSPKYAAKIAHILRILIISKKQVQQSTENLNHAQEKIRKIDEWFNNTFKEKIKKTETSIKKLNDIYGKINKQMEPFKKNIDILQEQLITDIKNTLKTILKEE